MTKLSTTSPAAVAAELAALAGTAFGRDRRTDDAQENPPGPRRQ